MNKMVWMYTIYVHAIFLEKSMESSRLNILNRRNYYFGGLDVYERNKK